MTELTQSKLFVLVETGEGRTFTGSTTLCKLYSGGGLKRRVHDVQLGPDGAVGENGECWVMLCCDGGGGVIFVQLLSLVFDLNCINVPAHRHATDAVHLYICAFILILI